MFNGFRKKEISAGDCLPNVTIDREAGGDPHWIQMIPAAFFTAVVIIIVRMTSYERPMDQFFWISDSNHLIDFFSYYKMGAITVCAASALMILLYRAIRKGCHIKKSAVYIPMMIYSFLVILSFAFSDYKIFALWGWNERFEGTMTLLGYMVMLFYIINSVNSEKGVKWIIYTLAVTSSLLCLLGLTQGLNHDFFRTHLGKLLITPSWFWGQLDSLQFTFDNQIYQTVYDINNVTFYLTMLLPVFGLLFIRSVMLGRQEPIVKKIAFGMIFTLQIYNMIASDTPSGFLGLFLFFVLLAMVVVLNKRLLLWWKPVVILILITLVISGITYSRWLPGVSTQIDASQMSGSAQTHKLDYMVTSGDAIQLGYGGESLTFHADFNDPSAFSITDAAGNPISASTTADQPDTYQLQDKRYNWINIKPAVDKNGDRYLTITTDSQEWPFKLTETGPLYRNSTGHFIPLVKVPSAGWENNQQLGNGRGYIWSRTIPMIKNTMILGYGADTYCIYFPQDDYVGKYNSGTFGDQIDIIVDKPHSMYLGIITGTGLLSLLAISVLWVIYLVQSIRIYRKEKYESFAAFVGAGIFLGVLGFLISGFIYDSTVSVMPVFYGLLGTGIAINMMLKRQQTPE